jgi:hypothetical protein
MKPFFQIIIGILIADFVIAIFHWIEDSYFSYCMNIPILGTIARDNEMHHYFPRDIIAYSYIKNMSVTLPISICIIVILFAISPTFVYKYKYLFITFFILGSISNILHKFAHMRECEYPILILPLYKYGLLVNHDHHKVHHEDPSRRYGVVLPFTNYILDFIGFWTGLESLIWLITGVKSHPILGYREFATGVNFTKFHENAKLSCPTKITLEDIEFLKKNLNTYYKCNNE